MRRLSIDVLARSWGSPTGGQNGMAIAAAFLASTLAELGHEVRRLSAPDGFDADLIITTISPMWRRTCAAAVAAAAEQRTIYWHHAGGVPEGGGCVLAAPPAIPPHEGWSRHVVLPPSSWAAEAGGARTGQQILVPGAGPAKGGHVARAVAGLCPQLSWYVLRGRSSAMDQAAWAGLSVQMPKGLVEPAQFLAEASAVLAPTRFEVHPLVLVEAAVRGIPIVCTDLPSTRCAAPGATFVDIKAEPEVWAKALLRTLAAPAPQKLQLRPYAEVVSDALEQMLAQRRVAA